jgi:hypothetical protein
MSRNAAELDEVVRLTTRRVWAALLAVLIVFGALVAWGLTARVESTLTLDGVLVAGAGPALVTAPADATVVALPRPAGGPVGAGDDLVVLDVKGERQTVRSPVGGAVTALSVAAGEGVEGGRLLATVEPAGARLGAVLFLDAARFAAVSPGAVVRGSGVHGRVTGVDPYPVSIDDVAASLGRRSLPGTGDGQRLVRVVHVDLGVPAWAGATLTPVRLALVLGTERPADLLRHGGA